MGPSDVTVPLFTREIVGVLSVPVRMVQYRTLWSLAMTAVWQMTAACSRSLLVMVPVGFDSDTRAPWTSGEKGECHRWAWQFAS